MGDVDPAVEELADRLEALADELGDRAVEVLRAAVEDGATARPELERRLTRARRSVDKAVGLLRGHAV
jgi:hypothetical protein